MAHRQPAGQHPGLARDRHPVPRRPAGPALPDAVREAGDLVTLRLLTYNIRVGGPGRVDATGPRHRRLSSDLVLLQEATRPAVVEQLAGLTGMPTGGRFRGSRSAIMSRQPVAQRVPGTGRGSRATRSSNSCRRAAPLRIFGVHLSAVHAAWTERRRVYRAARAAAEASRRHQHGLPRPRRRLQHAGAGRDARRAPTAAAAAAARLVERRPHPMAHDSRRCSTPATSTPTAPSSRAAGYTMPARDPHVRLDYVFVPGSAIRIVSCDVVSHRDAVAASDHLPVITELDIPAEPVRSAGTSRVAVARPD